MRAEIMEINFNSNLEFVMIDLSATLNSLFNGIIFHLPAVHSSIQTVSLSGAKV